MSPSLLLGLAAACQTRLCCRAMTASAMTRVTAAYTSTTRSVPPFVKSFHRDVIVLFLCNSSLTLFTQGNLSDGDLMLICITPDQDGKFGFNVKVGLTRLVCLFCFFAWSSFYSPKSLFNVAHQGGVDQKMPLAISHIKPESPVRRNTLWCFVFPDSAMITQWCDPGTIWTQR